MNLVDRGLSGAIRCARVLWDWRWWRLVLYSAFACLSQLALYVLFIKPELNRCLETRPAKCKLLSKEMRAVGEGEEEYFEVEFMLGKEQIHAWATRGTQEISEEYTVGEMYECYYLPKRPTKVYMSNSWISLNWLLIVMVEFLLVVCPIRRAFDASYGVDANSRFYGEATARP